MRPVSGQCGAAGGWNEKAAVLVCLRTSLLRELGRLGRPREQKMLFEGTFPWLSKHVKSGRYTAWLMNLEYRECSEQIRGGRESHSDLPFQRKWSKWLISKPLRRKSCIFLLRTAHKGSPRRLLGRDYQQHWSFQKHAKEAIHHACGATK